MLSCCKRTVVLFCCCLGAHWSYSQESGSFNDLSNTPNDGIPRFNRASILFDRNQNTFNWIGTIRLDTTIAGTAFSLNELYTSNIILIEKTPASPERRLQSNQQRLTLRARQPIAENISAIAGWSTLVYSDNKAVGLSKASVHSIIGGLDYLPIPELTVSPLLGYRWDYQGIGNDEGLHYALAARTKNIYGEGYVFNAEAQYHRDRLDPRTLDGHFAKAQIVKQFDGRTRDSLHAGFYYNRREFYSQGDSSTSIDSRLEHVLSIGNLLDYELNPRLLTSIFFGLSSRTLDKDTRYTAITSSIASVIFPTTIDEFRLETYVQAAYREARLNTFLRFHYTERSENHAAELPANAPHGTQVLFEDRNAQEHTKNNTSKRSAITGTTEWSFSSSDTLAFAGSSSILRYDTPSNANSEDRDELLIAVSIGTRHRLSRYLHISTTLDGTLSHAVYLLKERSGNNNYNRVLRLAPRVTYQPVADFSSTNTFEVLANYTVYDFEEQSLQIKSFSYRQFGWLDSTNLELHPRLGLDFLVYLKLYERGLLRWADFKERTENSFVDQAYALQARFSASEGLMFAVGLRYFSQTRYSFSDRGKVLDTVIRSVGPTCAILWTAGGYGEVGLKGWYEHRSQTNGFSRDLANMSMNVSLNF